MSQSQGLGADPLKRMVYAILVLSISAVLRGGGCPADIADLRKHAVDRLQPHVVAGEHKLLVSRNGTLDSDDHIDCEERREHRSVRPIDVQPCVSHPMSLNGMTAALLSAISMMSRSAVYAMNLFLDGSST